LGKPEIARRVAVKEQVLVLNQNYEPLNVCSWQRALTLLYLGKAVAFAHGDRTAGQSIWGSPYPR
jgi:hypothetical protein